MHDLVPPLLGHGATGDLAHLKHQDAPPELHGELLAGSDLFGRLCGGAVELHIAGATELLGSGAALDDPGGLQELIETHGSWPVMARPRTRE